MRIALIGLGVVGEAMRQWLAAHAKDTELVLHDPKFGLLGMCSDTSLDAAFIAVPVPTMANRDLDASILRQAISKVPYDVPVFIRSTILPRMLRHVFPGRKCIPMPEFLTARHAAQDFERLPLVVGSGGDPKIIALLESIFPGKAQIHVSSDAACLAKYAHNVFGAMKVNLFNIVAAAAKHCGLDYLDVLRAGNITEFLGVEHLMVPGPDKRFGYGGACFPKDVAAFIGFLEDNGLRGSVSLRACELDNALFRAEEAGTWIRKSS